MIATPLLGGMLPDEGGTYPGDMYAPVTIPTAYPYAIPAPSTAQPQQTAYPPSPVPLNAYVATSPPSVMPAPTQAPAPNDDCGCSGGGTRPLQWYEIVSAVALVLIALAAFTSKR